MSDTPPKTHAEVADAIVERAKARGKGMVIVDREYEELENDIATALREADEAGFDRAVTPIEERSFNRGRVAANANWIKHLDQCGIWFDECASPMFRTKKDTILDDAGNVRRDRLKEMREVRGWLSSALDRMELADVTRLPWLAAALTNSYQQLDAFIGEREAALHAKDAQGAKHE